MRANKRPIAIIRRSCSDSSVTASQWIEFSEATGSAPSVLRYFSSADAGSIRQILHVRFRLAAGEGEHEFTRAGLAIAARLGKGVFGRARDGEGFDETVIEHVRSPLAIAQADAAGSTPRPNVFSANQTDRKSTRLNSSH